MDEQAKWYHKALGRVLAPIARNIRAALATVTAVSVGKKDDGLTIIERAGTPLDKEWGELLQEFTDALTAWRKNPMARRVVGTVTAYVVGGEGFRLTAPGYKLLDDWLKKFSTHPNNRLTVRQSDWCDELCRTGELFPILYTNPIDGMTYLRAMPASSIKRIDWKEGDWEDEQIYYEKSSAPGGEEKPWYHPSMQDLSQVVVKNGEEFDAEKFRAMLHYAINRPVGCVRGESDLAPVLPWLKRYSRWLEDRVRINATFRAFLWFVSVPGRLVDKKRKQYSQTPPAGSVMVLEKGMEEWEANSPEVNAADVSADGTALRLMNVAGSPGLSLLDFGEAEQTTLAAARTLGEQRRRFLLRRQAYFGWILADIAVHSWNRRVQLGKKGRLITAADITVRRPDIAPEDNMRLASAARVITQALQELQNMVGRSDDLKKLSARLLLKFAGEGVSDVEFDNIVSGVMVEPIETGVDTAPDEEDGEEPSEGSGGE